MIKLLVADDHDVVRHGLRGLLTRTLGDVHIEEARDSREAAEWIAKEPWDVVILDINMPGRSGLDVLAEARQIRPKIGVIMLSGFPEEEFAMRAFKLGASAFLSKRNVADELPIAVRKVLDGGRYVTAEQGERLAAVLGGDSPQAAHEALSSRELQVLRLIALGRTGKEIAAELALSEKTIATYRARIAEKMGMGGIVELTRYAIKHKLVD